jgi:hypothetical protein
MKIFSGALPKKKPPEGGCHLDDQLVNQFKRSAQIATVQHIVGS